MNVTSVTETGRAALDAVIVAYRSDAVIEDSVRALGPLDGAIVVVDHYDGEAGRRAAGLGARMVHDPANPGFGAGQNRGVALTTSPFVLLCNPDAVVEPDAVRQGVDYLAAHPHVAAVEGVIVNSRTAQPERSQGVELGPLHLFGRALGARRLLDLPLVRRLARRSSRLRDHVERTPLRPTDVEALAATAIVVRRAAFEEVGGFDARYFLYGEDMDLCHRLRRRGWKLVAVPEVWARHRNGDSSESSLDRELHWWRGTMTFAACWWPTGEWSLAVAAAAVGGAWLVLRQPRRAREAISALLLEPIQRRRAERRVSERLAAIGTDCRVQR